MSVNQINRMKNKYITITISAILLTGVLITTQVKSQAESPRVKHWAVVLGWITTDQLVTDPDGWQYRQENGAIVLWASASSNAPTVTVGANLGVTIAELLENGGKIEQDQPAGKLLITGRNRQ